MIASPFRFAAACAFLALSLLSHARGAQGEDFAWRQLGPPAADVLDLVVRPDDPGRVYAAAAGGGVFVSFDGGTSWLVSNQGLATPDASALHVDALQPQRLYLGNSTGDVYRSEDAGATWQIETAGLATNGRAVRAFAQQPGTGVLLLATAGSGVFRRTSNGWSAANTGLGSSFVESVHFDPAAPNIAWASTATAGLFRSTDGGLTWLPRNSGLGSLFVTTIQHHPAQSGRLWVGTSNGGVFASTDDGATWQSAGAGLPTSQISHLAVNSTHLAAATASGAHRLPLGGSLWTPLGGELVTTARRVLQASGGWLVGTAGRGVFQLPTGSGEWQESNDGLLSSFVLTAHTVGTTGDLLVGTSGGGAWRLDQSGWVASSQGLDSPFVAALGEDPTNGDLFAGTIGRGVARSENAGVSWQPANQGLENAFVRRLARSAGGDLLAATSSGVYRSADGAAWAASGLAARDVRSLTAVPVNSLQWVAGDGSGEVHHSADDGATWVPLATLGSSVRTLLYTTSLELLAGTDDGIVVQAATDRGFSEPFLGCGLVGERVSGLAELQGVLYAATLDSGVWARPAGCGGPSSWQRVDSGLLHTGIYGLDLVDYGAAASPRLAASTYGGGVFVLLPVVPLFADGWESGDLGAWSDSNP